MGATEVTSGFAVGAGRLPQWLRCIARRDPTLFALWQLGVNPYGWKVRAG